MTRSLAEKSCVVTGVSSGIGAALAEELLACGASVVGIARRGDLGRALVEKFDAGNRFEFVEGDVTDAADRSRVTRVCMDRTGRVDLLVNNAGISGDVGMLENIDLQSWEATVAVNLTAAVAMAQAVLPYMKTQNDGLILNIGSINTCFGVAGMAPYNITKAGLASLTRTIASEGVSHNVRANTIILGAARSDMNRSTMAHLAQQQTGRADPPADAALAAMERVVMEPREVAAAIALLCRPEARLINGSEIAIDQAFSAGAAVSRLVAQGAASLYA